MPEFFFSNYCCRKMTGTFTDKNIQRGLYVRFRTEIDWTGSN